MICPACQNHMVQLHAGEIVVDVCQDGCGGVWFDAFELKRLEQQPESANRALLHFNRPTGLPVDLKPKRDCPRCAGIVMMRRFFSRRKEIEVDECPGCGGLWLDGGELARVQDELAQRPEVDPARESFVRFVYRYVSKEPPA